MRAGDVIGQEKVRQLLFHAGHIRGMVQILRIALLGNGERSLGQAGFNGQYGVRIFFRLRISLARQRKYFAHVGLILLALFN